MQLKFLYYKSVIDDGSKTSNLHNLGKYKLQKWLIGKINQGHTVLIIYKQII